MKQISVLKESSFDPVLGGKAVVLVDGKVFSMDLVKAKDVFSSCNFVWLNPIQSVFVKYYCGGSAVVTSPTSSGKTEIALFVIGRRKGRVLYVVPTRALAREKARYLRRFFPKEVRLKLFLHGDEEDGSNARIIVTTVDSLVVGIRNKVRWCIDPEVLVLDEIHQIVKEGGFYIEEILVRYKGFEIIGLSATLPGAERLAMWMSVEMLLQSDWRPVPLERKTGFVKKNEVFSFIEKVMSEDKKTIIFVPRKRLGWEALERFQKDSVVVNRTLPFDSDQIQMQFGIGIAFHCADVPYEELEEIEKRFLKKDDDIRCLLATHTLAYGVNLPAQRVVVLVNGKGDEFFPSILDILQMEGRAGRLGMCEKGESVIVKITGNKEISGDEDLKERLSNVLDMEFRSSIEMIIMGRDLEKRRNLLEYLLLISVNEDKDYPIEFFRRFLSTKDVSYKEIGFIFQSLQDKSFIAMTQGGFYLTKKGLFSVLTNTPPDVVQEFLRRYKKHGLNVVSVRPLLRQKFQTLDVFLEDKVEDSLLMQEIINEGTPVWDNTHVLMFVMKGGIFGFKNIEHLPGELGYLKGEWLLVLRTLSQAKRYGLIDVDDMEILSIACALKTLILPPWGWLGLLPSIGYIRGHALRMALEEIGYRPPLYGEEVKRYFSGVNIDKLRNTLEFFLSKRLPGELLQREVVKILSLLESEDKFELSQNDMMRIRLFACHCL